MAACGLLSGAEAAMGNTTGFVGLSSSLLEMLSKADVLAASRTLGCRVVDSTVSCGGRSEVLGDALVLALETATP
jgi:hypothetical protein